MVSDPVPEGMRPLAPAEAVPRILASALRSDAAQGLIYLVQASEAIVYERRDGRLYMGLTPAGEKRARELLNSLGAGDGP